MSSNKITIGAAILGGSLLLSWSALAADATKVGDAKNAKAYTLKTCIVSDEKLGLLSNGQS